MAKKSECLLFGAHMSITGGFEQALKRGESIDCTAIQIFTKSNRQWYAKEIPKEQAELFINTYKNSRIKSVVAHASYLINIGSANKEINAKSFNALVDELQRCEMLNIPFLILHPGSRQESSIDECLDLIADNINKAFEIFNGNCILLLENTAGMGTSVGHSFEQLSQIINKIKKKERIGICFDTCHAFAAGYQFDDDYHYNKLWEHFEKTIGIALIKAMHINDSKGQLGCKLDRHEHIGRGKIGLSAFSLIFNDERFFYIPKILETPINNGNILEYIPDIKKIHNLISSKNKDF